MVPEPVIWVRQQRTKKKDIIRTTSLDVRLRKVKSRRYMYRIIKKDLHRKISTHTSPERSLGKSTSRLQLDRKTYVALVLTLV